MRETLTGTTTHLTSLHFHRGGNIYVFSYEIKGKTKHTFIDAGDPRHQNHLLQILTENGIDAANIERIIITHHHIDHCGLAGLLAEASKARILVHARFQSFVEGEMNPHERTWFGDFQASQFKRHSLVYLSQSDKSKSIELGGIDFPILGEPIDISSGGRLHILGCPESMQTHTPDQIIVLYSARPAPFRHQEKRGDFLPTDDLLFSGDLWLMHGPPQDLAIGNIPRLLKFRMAGMMSHGRRRNHREQDAAAKEALKRFFCLVRVKPGHGEEFIGSRIIPNGLLADRDLLVELGYESDADKSVLRTRETAPRVAGIKERAYSSFVKELGLWLELGYTRDDISAILVRIYREQSGGSRLVKSDRRQRRERLKEILFRQKDDSTKAAWLRQLAESTLDELRTVRASS